MTREQADRGPARASLDASFRPAPFRAAWWLAGRHLQTLGGRYLRPRPDPGVTRLRIETPDDDFLDLDVGRDPGEGAPVVLILHGLEGSSARTYVRNAMREIARLGMLPVGMNFRACSGEPNRRPRFYHSGETGDPAHVLETLRRRHPDRAIGLVGFSLGGNILLRLLAEWGADPPPSVGAAVAISVPFDLTAGTRRLEATPMGRAYAGYFLRSLKAKVRAKAGLLEPLLDLDRAFRARTVREFDEAVTAPLHGFPDAATYYREASSAPVLDRIRVPTLVLHAMDDPFLPREAVPVREVGANPSLAGVFLEDGGHVGFVAGRLPWRPTFWADLETARFLRAHLAGREGTDGSGPPTRP